MLTLKTTKTLTPIGDTGCCYSEEGHNMNEEDEGASFKHTNTNAKTLCTLCVGVCCSQNNAVGTDPAHSTGGAAGGGSISISHSHHCRTKSLSLVTLSYQNVCQITRESQGREPGWPGPRQGRATVGPAARIKTAMTPQRCTHTHTHTRVQRVLCVQVYRPSGLRKELPYRCQLAVRLIIKISMEIHLKKIYNKQEVGHFIDAKLCRHN